ncbi:50S ribosomal protein L2 [Striga asiatica]|uniref:50S ribosomal protein L2 n=1 Tax=Striga asiatica TaxID=4170 RepID=A0A5A7QDH0_STRAF|nr:50S ribosomal protein L2 [Striga asiatica]
MVTLIDIPPPPPLPNIEDWRRFREVGLLDVVALERRDREALQEKVERLETEVRRRETKLWLILYLTGKDNMVALINVPPPPPPNIEYWRRFREVGLLDVVALERRDRDALQEKVERLETEVRRRETKFLMFFVCGE